MAASAAERQRRYRRHNKGDHSLCPPTRECRNNTHGVASPVTPVVTRDAPTVGGSRGRRLWDEMGGDDLSGGRRVLLEEACRIADRLDALHKLLGGDARDWLSIVETKGHPDRQEIVIDKLLAETRQQATALKQIIAELRQSGADDGQERGVDILDQLAAQRAKRLANASGG